MRYNLIRPDKIQLDVTPPFFVGDYEFTDCAISDLSTAYFVVLTDPNGKEHIGSSLLGRVEAAMAAADQCEAASGFDVDLFDLEMVARNIDKREKQESSDPHMPLEHK